jgi:hypothetical protein
MRYSESVSTTSVAVLGKRKVERESKELLLRVQKRKEGHGYNMRIGRVVLQRGGMSNDEQLGTLRTIRALESIEGRQSKI